MDKGSCIIFCVLIMAIVVMGVSEQWAKAYERSHGECPGDLLPDDYYTPEE